VHRAAAHRRLPWLIPENRSSVSSRPNADRAPLHSKHGRGYQMKHNVMLPIASLLTMLLLTFHLTDDILRGMAPGGFMNLFGTLFLVVWLYGTLVLAERRSGYVIVLLASLLGSGIPAMHMRGTGLGAGRGGGFFFVWTLLAVGAAALFSVVLSVRGLWSLRRGRSPRVTAER
jgi:hypothetical protein